MKCEICGTELRAEPAITEPGWIIFHECIIRGDTEQEVIDNYEKIRVSAHNSDYAKSCDDCIYGVDGCQHEPPCTTGTGKPYYKKRDFA